jgi:hypothetical protein
VVKYSSFLQEICCIFLSNTNNFSTLLYPTPPIPTITPKMQFKSLAVIALSAGALAAPEKRQATDANA